MVAAAAVVLLAAGAETASGGDEPSAPATAGSAGGTEFDLQQAEGVRWTEGATVFGELDGETLTVAGSAASASLPGPAGG